jgi:hypothetical protein
MSEHATKNENYSDDSGSSVSSKWATESMDISDSFSNYGPAAVEQMNDYLNAQDQARRDTASQPFLLTARKLALKSKRAHRPKLNFY